MRHFILIALLSTGLVSMMGAQSVSVPNTFAAGDAISAAKVNANFQALVTAVSDNLVPIGTIIASTLTQAQMDAQCGAGLWAIADGSAAPAAYATATGQPNLPDLRGQFLRGLNNGRTDGKQDPAGPALGDYETDQLQGHAHGWYPASPAGTPAPSSYFSAGSGFAGTTNDRTADLPPRIGGIITDPSTTSGAARVGVETRPKSVAVNYFIKVK
jgi:hypothetical protein